ncbi:CU044_5270 family protein [Actinomadura barringtoniae]|uniref:CU044_5270 family protein n=1 Tax=Actinomadura barringtoniae TaxID=1427535 RepID=A0A939T284_9ACTN|nr:CU044_5270 family protein [Actinomadura barringtoniae]MBO2449181.1 CU044_5270 family protein [Actinomadura barringtoniae]
MNELTELRDLFGDPPAPTPHAVAAARARLTEDAPPPRRRPHLRLRLGPVVGVAAMGAAAVMVFTQAGPVTPEEPGHPSPRTGAPSAGPQPIAYATARQVLLAAATSAERRPATDGAYWRVSAIRTNIAGAQLNVSWYGKDGVYRQGMRNLTGSAAGQAWLSGPLRSPRPFEISDQGFTLAELRSLPTTPRGIVTWAHGIASKISPKWRETDVQSFTDGLLTQMLAQAPAPPAARAAAFRALASRPGVKSGGVVRDERGREGNELRFGKAGQNRVVVDPATSQLLSETARDARGRTYYSNVYLEVGWTDERPRVPAAS